MLITVIHIFDKLLETLYNLLNIELLNCSVIIKRVYSSLSYYNNNQKDMLRNSISSR